MLLACAALACSGRPASPETASCGGEHPIYLVGHGWHAGLDSLAAYLHRAYARDATGRVLPLGPGLYGESRFYAGREPYHLFHNCNAWTAQALEAAGCPVTTTRVLTVKALMAQARRFGEVIQQAQ